MNVLLIEDSHGDILLIDTAFKQLEIDYEITVKTNGREALEFIIQSDQNPFTYTIPDLIILDLNLPIVNGFEVLKQIKKNTALFKVPVIIFSSSADEKDQTKALDLGAAAYFTKPVEYDDYVAVIENILSMVKQ